MDAMIGNQDIDLQQEAAQKLLVEAQRRLEVGLTVYPILGDTSKGPTGERYIEVLSGYIRREEDRTSSTPDYATPQEAIAAWEEAARTYATRFDPVAGEVPWVLYWRIPPGVDHWEGRWKVYSRFLVSNKPVTGA
jgi:hypothetical protein